MTGQPCKVRLLQPEHRGPAGAKQEPICRLDREFGGGFISEGVTRPVHSQAPVLVSAPEPEWGRGWERADTGLEAKGSVDRAQEPPTLVSCCCMTNDPRI